MAPLGPAEEALLLELNLVGHALRVGGASVALLSTATAPQLVLDLAPNRRGPWLVDHVVDDADVSPPAPPPSQIWAVEDCGSPHQRKAFNWLG